MLLSGHGVRLPCGYCCVCGCILPNTAATLVSGVSLQFIVVKGVQPFSDSSGDWQVASWRCQLQLRGVLLSFRHWRPFCRDHTLRFWLQTTRYIDVRGLFRLFGLDAQAESVS